MEKRSNKPERERREGNDERRSENYRGNRDGGKKSFNKDNKSENRGDKRKPRREGENDRGYFSRDKRSSYGGRSERSDDRRSSYRDDKGRDGQKSYGDKRSRDDRPSSERYRGSRDNTNDRRDNKKRDFRKDDRRPYRGDRSRDDRPSSEGYRGSRDNTNDKRDYKKRDFRKDDRRPYRDDRRNEEGGSDRNREDKGGYFDRDKPRFNKSKRKDSRFDKPSGKRPFSKGKKNYRRDGESTKFFKTEKRGKHPISRETEVRLNRFIANSGICSRREADDYIKGGFVSLNGEVVTEMGIKVKPTDKVAFRGKPINFERPVYILMNKPTGHITTLSDENDRKTIIDLLGSKVKERVYPVGRLDKDTTGVLLLTNDGDLTKKLTHPSYEVKKVYHVKLHKEFSEEDLQKLNDGFELTDGFIKADEADYADGGEDKRRIGIEIHSGRNRIIRRMMEHLGYRVVTLDRVSMNGLTKKRVPRGKWRYLNDKEVAFLKRNSS